MPIVIEEMNTTKFMPVTIILHPSPCSVPCATGIFTLNSCDIHLGTIMLHSQSSMHAPLRLESQQPEEQNTPASLRGRRQWGTFWHYRASPDSHSIVGGDSDHIIVQLQKASS